MVKLILKGLGVRKVRSILNQFLKDQFLKNFEEGINNHNIVIDGHIWLGDYCDCGIFFDEPIELDILVKFINHKL